MKQGVSDADLKALQSEHASLIKQYEEIIKDKIEVFVKNNSNFFEVVGAKAVQGQAYLPGKDE